MWFGDDDDGFTCYICHIYVGFDHVDCDYGGDDDGYWVTDAWHRVVWFVDHPV